MIDTGACRPWFADMTGAQAPTEAARWPVELALTPSFDPAYYGQLVQFGNVLPWAEGTEVTAAADSGTVAQR